MHTLTKLFATLICVTCAACGVDERTQGPDVVAVCAPPEALQHATAAAVELWAGSGVPVRLAGAKEACDVPVLLDGAHACAANRGEACQDVRGIHFRTTSPASTYPALVAHELGHALGSDHVHGGDLMGDSYDDARLERSSARVLSGVTVCADEAPGVPSLDPC